jgi:hypothetical protein
MGKRELRMALPLVIWIAADAFLQPVTAPILALPCKNCRYCYCAHWAK